MWVKIIAQNIHKRSNPSADNFGRYTKWSIYCTIHEESFFFTLIVSKEKWWIWKTFKLICPGLAPHKRRQKLCTLPFTRYTAILFLHSTLTLAHKHEKNNASNLSFSRQMKYSTQKSRNFWYLWQLTLSVKNTSKNKYKNTPHYRLIMNDCTKHNTEWFILINASYQ